MKKIILLLFVFFTISSFCQEFSKEDLKKEFQNQFKFKHNDEAFLLVELMESNFGVTEDTKYYKALLTYYQVKEKIERKKTFVVQSAMKLFDNLIKEGKLSEKRIHNVKYFKVIISFSLLYHLEHRKGLKVKYRKEVADTIIKESNYLISPYVLGSAEKSDIERVLKRTKENYDYYTGPVEKIGM
jgi:hypothetical protein